MAAPGSDTPYAMPDDLRPFVDKRMLKQLLSDTGKPIVPDDPWTEAEILPLAILSAGGEVESAVMVGGVYTPDDLHNLTANSKQFLYRIISGLMVGALLERRVIVQSGGQDEQSKRPGSTSWAQRQLSLIRKGERIFSVVAVVTARTASSRDESQIAQIERQSIVARNRRMFGPRGFRNQN